MQFQTYFSVFWLSICNIKYQTSRLNLLHKIYIILQDAAWKQFIMWMQESCICILVILQEMGILCSNFFCFRGLNSFMKNTMVSNLNQSFNYVFYLYFQNQQKTQFYPKCQLRPCHIYMTNYKWIQHTRPFLQLHITWLHRFL